MLGRRYTAWLAALLLVLISVSCGSDSTPASNGNNSVSVPALPLGPAMDVTHLIPKQTLVQRNLLQNVPISTSSNAGHNLETDFMPTLEEPMAWAIYKFDNVAPYYSVTGVTFTVFGISGLGPNNNQIFVGFADYNSKQWKWQPLPDQNHTSGYDSQAVSLSIPGGNFFGTGADGAAYIAVVTYGRPLSVISCVLNVDEGAPAPLGLTASQGTVDGAVKLTWIDPSITFGPDRPGDTTFRYNGVYVERSLNGTDWEEVGRVGDTASEFIDTDVDPAAHITYFYRIRTQTFKPGPQPGMPSAMVSGYPGARPVAAFQANGTAPDLVLDASGSFDDDVTPVISEYRWKVSYPQDMPGFVYEFAKNSADPFTYSLTDMTKLNRIDLTVVDDEGFTSAAGQDFEATSEPYILWAPDNGCVTDDANKPDPKDRVQGGGPGAYTVGLGFKVLCGNPNIQVDFDSWFDGTFGPNDGVNVVLVKPFSNPPNGPGAFDYAANVPVAQPSGDYYMAIRVTDQSDPPNVWIYMWPDKVTLAAQP